MTRLSIVACSTKLVEGAHLHLRLGERLERLHYFGLRDWGHNLLHVVSKTLGAGEELFPFVED